MHVITLVENEIWYENAEKQKCNKQQQQQSLSISYMNNTTWLDVIKSEKKQHKLKQLIEEELSYRDLRFSMKLTGLEV